MPVEFAANDWQAVKIGEVDLVQWEGKYTGRFAAMLRTTTRASGTTGRVGPLTQFMHAQLPQLTICGTLRTRISEKLDPRLMKFTPLGAAIYATCANQNMEKRAKVFKEEARNILRQTGLFCAEDLMGWC